MSNTTQPKHADILHTQENIKETHNKKSNSLITHEPIEGTPFAITGASDKGYFLRLGDYRLTQDYKTTEEVRKILHTEMWDILIKVIAIILEKNTQQITEDIRKRNIQ